MHNSDLITASENEPKVSVVDGSLLDSQSMVSNDNNNAENEEEILDPETELNKATSDSMETINQKQNQNHQHQSKTFTNMMANMMENLTENVIRLNQTGIGK